MPATRTFKYYSSLDESGALPFAVDGYAQLLRDDLADNRCNVLSGHFKTVTCSERGQLVGVICFNEWNLPSRWWIYFGYVSPERRRAGVYTALWQFLLRTARACDVTMIGGATYVDNQAMRTAMEKLGRRPRSITYEYELPGVLPDDGNAKPATRNRKRSS